MTTNALGDLMTQVTSLENMMLAWRKLERAFNYGDIWFDELLIAEFKMNLVDNLKELADSIRKNEYRMKPIRPIPFPKGGNDENGELKVRQSFFIDFRDQLAWMALCNVIGHVFDRKMPAWSFGNRLYVSTWMEKDQDGNNIWKVGNYRNTSRHLYRKWTQSWPLMRRRITASLKMMAGLNKEDLDNQEKQTQEDEMALGKSQEYLKLAYLEEGYFDRREKPLPKLYWAGIDLTKFYQQVKMDTVKNAILKELQSYRSDDDSIYELIRSLCAFEVDYSDYGYDGGDKDLETMQLNREEPFDGLPTGLIAAGFLANIFMLEIDAEVNEALNNNRNVIHFRYVDDHVIIATSPEILFEWTAWYQELLAKHKLEVNIEKLTPDEISNKIVDRKDEKNSLMLADYKDYLVPVIEDVSAIDPFFPTPLMTQTLQKVSQLQGMNLNMLSPKEYAMVFSELQSLLVADLSEQEIKKSTRISFACTMLSRLIVDGEVDYEAVKRLRLEWLNWSETEYKTMKEGIEKRTPLHGIDTEDKLQALLQRVTQIVFDGVGQIDIDKLKKDYPFTARQVHPLERLNKTLEAGEKLTKSKERLIFNMLMHALDDVPDKVRVWIRAMGYCVKHQPHRIDMLYKKLNQYENNNLHHLSVEYLRGLLDLLRADHIIKATYRLVTDDYKYRRQKEMDKAFLKEAFKVEQSSGKLFIRKDAEQMMKKAKAFYNLHAEKIGLEMVPEEEWFFNNVEGYHDCNTLDSTFWLLWIVAKLKYWKRDEMPVITETMKDYFGEANPESPYYKAFFMAYLREICLTDAEELTLPQDLEDRVDWINDELKYIMTQMSKAKNQRNIILKDDDKKPNCDGLEISVTKWIEEAKEMREKDGRHSFIYSELIAVMMGLSIISAIREEGEGIDKLAPHPDNFWFLKKETVQSDWNTLLGKINDNETLTCKYIATNTEDKDCYRYLEQLDKSLPKPLTLCYGLGLIFLQMLSKRTILPWVLNVQEAGYDWQRILHDLQGKGQISSLNYRIVYACLSPRQRENWRLDKILEDEYVEEAFMDNPRIHTINDLEKELRKSLESLKDNLISVANEEHRQLIIIDLL